MANPIRLGTSTLTGRIYAGRPAKDGVSFKGGRFDVTSDALRCIAEKVGIGNQITVEVDGVAQFVIAILPTVINQQEGRYDRNR